jgi:CheY-like chemotaxis protein
VVRILLVEDNPIDARLMHRTFREMKDWPTEITWVDDGQKALWYLRSLEEGGVQYPPGLVLLDVNLPRYNGFQVLAAFRSSAAVWNMPIFLFSSSPAESLAALAEDNHVKADGCFEKPYGLKGFEDIGSRIRICYEKSAHTTTGLASL